jgi:hypothetical protein
MSNPCPALQVIDSMAPGSAKVLDQVLKLIDAYDLYGSVAYPKRHTQDDISDIYLLPAATRGVFVNIALQVRTLRCACLCAYSTGHRWQLWQGMPGNMVYSVFLCVCAARLIAF